MNALRSMATRSRILLLILAGLLAVVAAWQDFAGEPEMPEIPAVASTALPELRKRDGGAVAVIDPQRFADAAARPLFNPSRVRFVQPQTATVQMPAAAAPFRAPVLLGIVGANGKRFALVRLADEREARRLREGDVYEGWHVDAIRSDAITFKNGSEEREIRLVAKETRAGMPASRR